MQFTCKHMFACINERFGPFACKLMLVIFMQPLNCNHLHACCLHTYEHMHAYVRNQFALIFTINLHIICLHAAYICLHQFEHMHAYVRNQFALMFTINLHIICLHAAFNGVRSQYVLNIS